MCQSPVLFVPKRCEQTITDTVANLQEGPGWSLPRFISFVL